jgi:hypothetical protein
MRMYQLFKRVPFQISGDEALNTKIIAPLVQEFRRRLKGFQFEEGSFKVWIEEADDLQINFIEPTVAACSFRISLEMRDAEDSGHAYRFGQFQTHVFANRLKELDFLMDNLALDVKF